MLPGDRLKLNVEVPSLRGAAVAGAENKMDRMIMRLGIRIRFMASAKGNSLKTF
jgi:hypothetical protein